MVLEINWIEYTPDIVKYIYAHEREWFDNHINDKDNNGNTALHLAITARNIAYTQFLLQKGASTTISNNAGKTCAQLLIEYDTNEQVQIFRQIYQALATGTVNTTRINNDSVLFAATKIGCFQLVKDVMQALGN